MELGISHLDDMKSLAAEYDVPFEDVLFIDFNRKGIKCDLDSPRVRFYFELEDDPHLEKSVDNNIMEYFLAMPTNSGMSNYELVDDKVYFNNDQEIGRVNDLVDDSIDAIYPRREATAMNLNPSVKSACRGCDFCYVNLLTANDQDAASKDQEAFLRHQAEKWIETYGLDDLSTLRQVAVLTGCFGGEEQALDSMRNVREIFGKYGFEGELFFFGSEIVSKEGLDRAQEIAPFALCLTLENFGTREEILKNHKERMTLDEAKELLGYAKENGIHTQFSYVLGLETLDVVVEKMKEFEPYVSRLPVINIFQPHSPESAELLHTKAEELEYFLEARKELECIFDPEDYRPRPWENYRSPWYLKYGNRDLTDKRLPEDPDGLRMDDQLPG